MEKGLHPQTFSQFSDLSGYLEKRKQHIAAYPHA